MLLFSGVTSLWVQPIRGLHCHSCAHFPSPPSSSPWFGNSCHLGSSRPSCFVLPQQLRFQCYKSSIAWFHKYESPSYGVSPWCHGCHPSPSSWTYFCWGLWIGHRMLDLGSFRLLRCLYMFSIAFTLALMLKEVGLSVKRMVKFTKNQHKKKVMIPVSQCRNNKLLRLFSHRLGMVRLMEQKSGEKEEENNIAVRLVQLHLFAQVTKCIDGTWKVGLRLIFL